MVKHAVFLGLFALALGSPPAWSASPVAFPTVTDWGEPTTLTGTLATPSGKGPFPAVVMLHPCSGMESAHGKMWAARLLDWGYVVLRVDSFTAARPQERVQIRSHRQL